MGNQWKSESNEIRTLYKTRAHKIKLEHSLKYPDYSYQPRKASEKKRRMSKKKLAALATASGVVVPTYDYLFEEASSPVADFTQLSGAWTTERQGVLPASRDLIGLVNNHNRAHDIGETLPPPLAPKEFGPSQALIDAQDMDISLIDWDALMGEIGFISTGNHLPGTVCPGAYLFE